MDAHAVIEANVVIGERSHIGVGCSIGEGVMIGRRLRPLPARGHLCRYDAGPPGRGACGIGAGLRRLRLCARREYGRYHKFPQVGELVIGEYVEIGANCTIDRGALDQTVIGPGTKLDNLVHIGHNDIVGANVVIAAQTGVSGSSEIGDGCVIGGQVGIGDHVKVEAGTMLGGQSGILPQKNFRGGGNVFFGTPARPAKRNFEELAALSRLARKKNSSF